LRGLGSFFVASHCGGSQLAGGYSCSLAFLP
jgi:hypothetical protein